MPQKPQTEQQRYEDLLADLAEDENIFGTTGKGDNLSEEHTEEDEKIFEELYAERAKEEIRSSTRKTKLK